MADISLRERLQPALLDRLYDDERVLHVIDLKATLEALAKHGVTLKSVADLMLAHGLKRIEERAAPASGTGQIAHLTFTMPSGEVPLARLKSLAVPRSGGGTISIGEIMSFEVHSSPNSAPEPAERRLISMRRLRESVYRDLGWLFNTSNLEGTEQDLQLYPEVQRSVLNFGLMSLTGEAATSVDPQRAARSIAEAIRAFEPRLSHVTVIPELSASRMDIRTLTFKIDAELWGRPAPQHLVLRTRLDVDSGDLTVTDAGG
ncbi:MAG TPA: type VI secretion system baseplate subunit TssE [Steroidobacteraceae bacterium]